MNILYIAYSCSPIHGSEDAIGWNIPVESAKNNRVFVITKEEQREYVEDYLKNHPLQNMEFFYVDIPKVCKRLFSGALYSGRLNIWNRRALRLAKEICSREKIDVIHQITPVEFRSIGNYGAIADVKFVCGPIAGGQCVPKALKTYIKSAAHVEAIRSAVNWWYRRMMRMGKRLQNVDYLLFANYETRAYLRQLCPPDLCTEVMTDIAIHRKDLASELPENKNRDGVCTFAVVGRLVYLKGHAFLLDVLARLPKDTPYQCRIVGDGKEMYNLKRQCERLGLQSKVCFEGSVPYTKIGEVYQSSDVLIMPSFREATGTVLLEAMSKGVPVISINKFGGATILDEEASWLYDGETKEEYMANLHNALLTCIQNPEVVKQKGKNARKMAEQYTWEEKMVHYQAIYEGLLRKDL